MLYNNNNNKQNKKQSQSTGYPTINLIFCTSQQRVCECEYVCARARLLKTVNFKTKHSERQKKKSGKLNFFLVFCCASLRFLYFKYICIVLLLLLLLLLLPISVYVYMYVCVPTTYSIKPLNCCLLIDVDVVFFLLFYFRPCKNR